MTIRKSVRTVYRYILFEYVSDVQKSTSELQVELNSVMRFMYGVINAPSLKIVSFKDGKGVLRCNRASFVLVRQALALHTNPAYRIRLLGSSGTIKGLFRS